MDGTPLMPTRRFRWVRLALDSGKAKPVQTKPFTIRLTYEPETRAVQEVTLGIDPGRTNIGMATVRDNGKCLYSSKAETRNKEIKELMDSRRSHRRASRCGERKARKRLAKKLGTTMKGLLRRKLPGYKDGTVTVKDIINTEARFNNRKRPKGWLTPTATQLLRIHLNLVRQVAELLPVSRIVLEINKFAFMALDNPDIQKLDYQNGPLKGYGGDVDKAVSAQQDGICLLCGERPIDHYHHIIPRSKGGSDTIANIAGICNGCHDRIHKDEEAFQELKEKKSGMNKKYGALSVLNQIIPSLFRELAKEYPGMVNATTGRNTKAFRDTNGIRKDHDTDAYCIACSVLQDLKEYDAPKPGESYQIKQYRRHERSIINAQIFRTYYLNGKVVAQNRKRATEQREGNKKNKKPSLEDWFMKMEKQYGTKEAERMRSQLTVKKSWRRYNTPGRILPGAVYLYKGKRHIMQGQQNYGYYVYPEDGGREAKVPAKDVKFVSYGGLVYV